MKTRRNNNHRHIYTRICETVTTVGGATAAAVAAAAVRYTSLAATGVQPTASPFSPSASSTHTHTVVYATGFLWRTSANNTEMRQSIPGRVGQSLMDSGGRTGFNSATYIPPMNGINIIFRYI